MISLPKIKRLENEAELDQYGKTYLQCSGLPVPEGYLRFPGNRVYAISLKGQMIGGFILGKGQSLRTLEVFARPCLRDQVYEKLGDINDFTEITCFWIAQKFRRNTLINTFIWLSLACCLQYFGTPKVLFGTCSPSLAKLYSVTPKSELVHKDFINGKRTFIFRSERNGSLLGFAEILRFKLSRAFQIRRQKQGQVGLA